MHCFNAGSFTSDAKRMCTMNSAFVLVLTVFLVSGEPVDIAVSILGLAYAWKKGALEWK